MQIAGNRCNVCHREIVLSSEGKFCSKCCSYVHLTCEPARTCGACGQPYQFQERPEADPWGEAVLPPALRPGRAGGPAFVMFVAVVLGFLVALVWYVTEYGG